LKKPIAKRTVLLDGDVVAYKVASKAEKPINWGDGMWTLHADEDEGKSILDAQLKALASELNAQKIIVALSCPSDECFRKEVFPAYKANRRDVRKPMILAALKQHFRDTQEVFERPKLEADDILGILATSPTLVPGEKIVASIDKDLKMIPGLHYHLEHKDRGVYSVTESEADYWHLFMTLTGDTTDGFPGCPGVGPVKATAILDTDVPVVQWEKVVNAYKKAGFDEAEALRQARVARILRRDDYDFKTKTVKLWEPK
jgi:DNA polymerase-1